MILTDASGKAPPEPRGRHGEEKGQAQIERGHKQPDFKAEQGFGNERPALHGEFVHGNGADQGRILDQRYGLV